MNDPLEIGLFEKLAEPFLPEQVHWRVGSTNQKNWKTGDKRRGMPLAYIDARDVMDRLDIVCGPEGWQDEYIEAGNGATCCRIGVALSDTWSNPNSVWIWKSDGAGATSYEGDKGQFSDAFKRAAVKHGIGRYLYDCKNSWIELDDRWNIPKSAMGGLEEALAKAGNRHQWGDRSTANMYRLFRDALRAYVSSGGDVDLFVKEHEGTIAQLKVGAKRELSIEVENLKEKEAA